MIPILWLRGGNMHKLYLVLADSSNLESAVYIDIKDKKAKHLLQTMKLGKKMYENDIDDLINVLEYENNSLLKGRIL